LAAVQRGLVTASELADTSGVPRRSLGQWSQVAHEAAAGAESGGEGLYWRLVHESPLPDPALNQWVVAAGHRYRVDALWPELGLGAEIDGREHHTRVADFERDHRRQNHLHAQGIMLIRFTVRQLLDDPQEVLRQTGVNLAARAHELGR
jgi:very-short-patch-repair endonuclease